MSTFRNLIFFKRFLSLWILITIISDMCRPFSKRILCLLLFACTHITLMSQTLERSAFASMGGYHHYGNGDISWTLGETLMERTPISGSHVTQGFQQPFRIIPAAAYLTNSNPDLRVYPNPFREFITLEGPGLADQTHLEVWDASGKLVFTQEVLPTTHRMEIQPGSLAAGTYRLVLHGREGSRITYSLLKP